MPIDVVVETEIDRPPKDVAGFATDPANDPVWIGGIVEAALLTEPPIGDGAKVRRLAKFLGKRIEYVTEVTGFDPGRSLAMHSISGPFPMAIRYEFEETERGTRMRIRNQGQAAGFFKLAEPLLARAIARNVRKDLAALKGLLETDEDRGGRG